MVNKATTYYENALADIKHSDYQRLSRKYSIAINDDGSVYDTVRKNLHKCLLDWLNFVSKHVDTPP